MISSIGVIKPRKRMWTFDCSRPNCFEAWNWNILSVTSGGSQVDYYHWYDFLSLSTHSVVVATKSSPLAGILSKMRCPTRKLTSIFLCNVTVTMYPKLRIILGEECLEVLYAHFNMVNFPSWFWNEVNTVFYEHQTYSNINFRTLNVFECVHLL